MSALRAYYRLQWLSLSRYWQSLPLLFRISGVILTGFLLFVLSKVKIESSDFRLMALISGAYAIISLNFYFSKAKKIFLQNYSIPVRMVLLVRMIGLSIPFFFIDWRVGCFCVCVATLIALLKPNKVSMRNQFAKFRPTYFFLKESFQWHSFYRQTGFYIHCLGLFGIIMGIIHQNPNLVLVSFSLIGIVSGIGSILTIEPLFFVKTYSGKSQFILRKTREIVYNIALLQIPLGALIAFFDINIIHLSYIVLSTIILSWITFAVKYSKYPDGVQAQILLFCAVLPLTVLCLVIGSWMLPAVLFIGLIAGYFMWQNLQQIFSQSQESNV